VGIPAIETLLTGTFRFVVQEHKAMSWPRAETPTHSMTMGFSPDLKDAIEHALRDRIDFLAEEKHLTRDDAHMLSSVAVNLDITERVDCNVGAHAMCPRT
jgi:acetamidase/formamidase